VIDCYIEPFDNWHQSDSNFDMSTINFTWRAISYQNKTLELKLDFNDPLAISPEFSFDSFVFHIKEKHDYFISAEHLLDLHDNFTTLGFTIQR
jgi:hypothetical protein